MTTQDEAIKKAVAETTRLQSRAAEPFGSRWVSANAGTGKTHVLVQRVLRLLLAGAKPDTILCLTYTNAAAAEMENRLFERLSTWAVMPDEKLVKILTELLGVTPDNATLQLAHTLFATTLETAGGLKVQTIHSFCERLLRRFPLEANVSPNSSLLDEAAARELKKDAVERILRRAVKQPGSPLGKALTSVIAFTTEDQFNNVIDEALGKRVLLQDIIKKNEDEKDPFGDAITRLHHAFGLTKNDSDKALHEQLAKAISNDDIEAVYDHLNATTGTSRTTAECLMAARHATNDLTRISHLSTAFMTRENKPKKTLMKKGVREAAPALMEKVIKAQERFTELWQKRRALRVVRASGALMRLSSEILQAYVSGKIQRAQLDFDDLIEKTNALLHRPSGAEWVLYKLDSGLDHILVDEAQDTSPDQWTLISKLTEEFFVGKGSHEDERLNRTVFAVGDEKQSIYSFQGAQPKQFAENRFKMEKQAQKIGHDLPLIPLTLSFRSAPAILEAVDAVFADPELVPGMTFSKDRIHHGAWRMGDRGHVEIWDLESAEKTEGTPAFDPLGDLDKKEDPKERLAERIATTIRHWLDEKTWLPSRQRPIEPGDILILVRKRHPFTQPMIRALKRLDIPVAGADRMKVAEQIAVEDLMALGDFLLLPEDDLALATVLKSPMFGLDDLDLFTIRRDPTDPDLVSFRKDGSERVKNIPLWWALQKAFEKGKNELYSAAYEQLKRWRMRADKVPPFELFAGVLDINGMREKLTSRLGSEAGDAINEFLSMALSFDEGAPPSLQDFLQTVRSTNSEIKRDMEKGINEVRIMTVHGAKGLEAEIVFMPDTTSSRSSSKSGAVQELAPLDEPHGTPGHFIWRLSKSDDVPQLAALKQTRAEADLEEYNRLLYVAMTRARDQLYICGWLGHQKLQGTSWYGLAKTGLEHLLVEENDAEGHKIWRFVSGDPLEEPMPSSDKPDTRTTALELPDWMEMPAADQTTKIKTLTPSNLIPSGLADHVKESLPEEPFEIEREQQAREWGKMRGTLIHGLLERLPDLSPDLWPNAIEHVLDAHSPEIDEKLKGDIALEVLGVLENAELAFLFAPNSSAEASFIAAMPHFKEGERETRMSGQIDRLVITDQEVLIIDYKTNRDTPSTSEQAPTGYAAQLAAYRLSMRPLFPGKTIRCALLWTRKPSLMWLPDGLLDEMEQKLPEFSGGDQSSH